MMRFSTRISLRFSLIASSTLLVTFLFIVIINFLQNSQKDALLQKALEQQDTTLRILTSVFSDSFTDISVKYDEAGNVADVRWGDIPKIEKHDFIDRVGAISGDTATLFVWSTAERDFIRRSTNIIKPDGTRAIGTALGTSNPVFAAMMNRETFRGEATIFDKPYLTIYEPIQNSSGDVVGIFYVGVEKTTIDAAISSGRWVSAATGVGIIVVGSILLACTISALLTPLTVLADRISKVANGNLDGEVPYTKRLDQIGSIAQQIDGFQADLKRAREVERKAVNAQSDQAIVVTKLREALARLAAQDLMTRISADDKDGMSEEYAPLRDDFNAFAGNLSSVISEIGGIADEVETIAYSIGFGSAELATRVERQAGTLAESATSLNRLSEASEQIVVKADQADSVAKSSQKLSSESRGALDDAIESIGRIEASSGAITAIVSVIEDIAFQTNLLALNAGVEAARVGEAGKGFAIVASEVRALAQNATTSAQDIKTLITASTAEIQTGSKLVQNTGRRLGQVLEHVETLGGLVSEIAGSVRQQARDLDEINGGVRQLDSLTQENAAMVEETNAAVQQLREESGNLSRSLVGFRTKKAVGVREMVA